MTTPRYRFRGGKCHTAPHGSDVKVCKFPVPLGMKRISHLQNR